MQPFANDDLDKRRCPFCQASLIEPNIYIAAVNHNYTECPNNSQHIKVWDRTEIAAFRIYFDQQYLRYHHFNEDKLQIGTTGKSIGSRIKIPMFDPFQMTYHELEKRVKLYALLS